MRAGDLATPYPVISAGAPAEEAAALLAEEDTDVLLVQGADGAPAGVLHDLGLLTAMLPHYLVEDRALARTLGEGNTAELWERLKGKSVGDLIDTTADPLPTVKADATLIEVAAQMCGTGAALVAVMDGERILGGVTSSALITVLLSDR